MLYRIMNGDIQGGFVIFAMVILAISLHEMAHAWMAYRKGDDTAARLGRLTLNPVVHFDPMGFLFILFAPIGWGKPVPVNPYNLKDIQRDGMWIAFAGPLSNILQAIFLAILFRILVFTPVGEWMMSVPGGQSIVNACILVFFWGVMINLGLAFFNLIPLFPLDGEKILIGLVPREVAYQIEDFRNHSMMIFFGLLMLTFVFNIDVFGFYFRAVVGPLQQLLIGYY